MAAMDQVWDFVRANWVGVVIGVVVAFIVAWLARAAKFSISVVRKYGLRKLSEALRDGILHVSAYPKIRADAGLTVAYIAKYLTSLFVNAFVCLLFTIAAMSGLTLPTGLRIAFGAVSLLFGYRVVKRWFVLSLFCGRTIDPIIEEVRKASPALRPWDRQPAQATKAGTAPATTGGAAPLASTPDNTATR